MEIIRAPKNYYYKTKNITKDAQNENEISKIKRRPSFPEII